MSVSSFSNFSSSNQEAYQKRSSEVIHKGIQMIEGGLKSAKIDEAFSKIFDFFRKERAAIAKDHQTEGAEDFGRLRKGSSRITTTRLRAQYEKYNQMFLKKLEKILLKTKRDLFAFKENLPIQKTKSLQRSGKFQVEIIDFDDMNKIAVELTSENTEKEMQKALNTKKDLTEIQKDWSSLKKFKDAFPKIYKKQDILQALLELKEFVPKHFMVAVCTLRTQINNKMYALSRYVTWLHADYKSDFVKRMKENSIVCVIHQDVFLIDDTMKEIAKVFKQAILWDSKKEPLEKLKNTVALFRFLFSHCMPTARGSGAIGDWMEKTLYGFHGLKAEYNKDVMPCTEPLACTSLSEYLERYPKIIKVSK